MAALKHVVIDTNVIVSSMLSSRLSPPVSIMNLVANEMLTVCYDERIWEEYVDVLYRPHFKFDPWGVKTILHSIKSAGFLVNPPAHEVVLPDPNDQAFYEVADLCLCPLITGNQRHFPVEPHIMTPAEFIESLRERQN